VFSSNNSCRLFTCVGYIAYNTNSIYFTCSQRRILSPSTQSMERAESRPTKIFYTFKLLCCRVFQKSSPLKLFGIFSLRLSFFCVKFCKFLGSSYPRVFTNFGRFIFIFHQMALIFPRAPIVFTLSNFE